MATKMAATYQFTMWPLYFGHLLPNFFHIWTTFIKLLFMSEYGFYLIFTKTDIPFSLQGIRRGPLSESHCSSCWPASHILRPSYKSVYWKTIFFISHPKHTCADPGSFTRGVQTRLPEISSDGFFFTPQLM